MNILHVASFVGNVGDNASHKGLNFLLKKFFHEFSIERMEIRKFYKNYTGKDKRKFDSAFVDYANKFDLVIIGGGGFLDYWIEGSETGTTIDIHPDLVSKINTPTLISSVGCAPHRNVPQENIAKFKVFLEKVNQNENIKILVRNDGSINYINQDIGTNYLNYVTEILDNGFFYQSELNYVENVYGDNYVAVNITNDQITMNSKLISPINKNDYLKEMKSVINYLTLNKKLKVVFVPHIYSDLKAVSELIELLDDNVRREYISVAPCVQYDEGAELIFNIYKNSLFSLGTRFHANVCSLALNVPTIGLVALDRVKYIYDEIDERKLYVRLDSDFSKELNEKIDYLLLNLDEVKSKRAINIERIKSDSLKIFFNRLMDLGFSNNAKK